MRTRLNRQVEAKPVAFAGQLEPLTRWNISIIFTFQSGPTARDLRTVGQYSGGGRHNPIAAISLCTIERLICAFENCDGIVGGVT